MLLTSFRVQWFKNLRQEVALEDLDRVNVIHGQNNVGKSNLIEAIGLFFVLVQEIALHAGAGGRARGGLRMRHQPGHSSDHPDGEKPPAVYRVTPLDAGILLRLGYDERDIFNKHEPSPIRLRAAFAFDPDGDDDLTFEAARVQRLELALCLEQTGPLGLQISIEHFQVNQHTDVLAALSDHPEHATRARELLEFLAWNPRVRERRVLRYALVQVDRSLLPSEPRTGDLMDEDARPVRALIPAQVWLALYDARESQDRSQNQRWQLFLDSMERFQGAVGEGAFHVSYDRQRNQADLQLRSAEGTIRSGLLGSGIQQVAGLLGLLATSRAWFLAIEEPELNLSYAEQHALKEALHVLAQKDQEPGQVFLTSHTAAFEVSEHFYAMRMSDQGPVVEKRPSSQARAFTGQDMMRPSGGARAPLSWVTSEGLVEVPAPVREALGIAPGGGGVRFIRNKASGRYEVLSTEQFLEILDHVDADESASEGESEASVDRDGAADES